MESPLVALFQLIDAFKVVGIDYVVVGSLASSVHGEYRASADIDVLTRITRDQIRPLINSLSGFYPDDLVALGAISEGRSFNVFTLKVSSKSKCFLQRMISTASNLQDDSHTSSKPMCLERFGSQQLKTRSWLSFIGFGWANMRLNCNGVT